MGKLVAFEAERAERHFAEGLKLLAMLDHRSRACTGAMAGIYHRLLARIAATPTEVLEGRMSLPTREKAWVASAAWPESPHELACFPKAGHQAAYCVVGGGLAGLAAAVARPTAGPR